MSSETQLKIINNIMTVLGYLPLVILMVIAKTTIVMKFFMLILFLGPRLYTDIKKGNFQF